MIAKVIQQFAVVTDEDTDSPKRSERLKKRLTRGPVEMIGRLIHGENDWLHPKSRRDLGPLALTVAECMPPIEPVVPDVEASSPGPGRRLAR